MTCRGTLETMLWLLAYTKPRQESLAEENLRRQGFEVFLPPASCAETSASKMGMAGRAAFPSLSLRWGGCGGFLVARAQHAWGRLLGSLRWEGR